VISETPTRNWRFVTNHARVLVCLAHDRDARLRDVGDVLDVTERRVFDIVNELVAAGFVTRTKTGRRNKYAVQVDAVWTEADGNRRTIGDLVSFLGGDAVAQAPG